jgi:hypothetical protein
MFAALVALAVLQAAPTPPEITTYGNAIVADFVAGKDGLVDRVDMGALLDRTFKGVDANTDFAKGFRTGAQRAGYQAGKTLLSYLKSGGSMAFRKPVTLDGEPAAQIRILNADGSFNVFELVVAKKADGSLEVVDVFDLVQGEKTSQVLRRLALMTFAEADQGLVDKLMGKEQLLIKNAGALKSMTEDIRAGKNAEAAAVYQKLPKELQDERTFLRLYAQVAFAVDEKEYSRALGRYLELYPEDPAAQVMAIDYHFLKKDWPKVAKTLDNVEKRVGTDDGWIEILRGNASIASGHRSEAKEHFKKAVAREKNMVQGYELLVGLSLEDKDWKETSKWLAAMETDGGIKLKDLSTVPEYKGFVGSKEGQAFLKRKPVK